MFAAVPPNSIMVLGKELGHRLVWQESGGLQGDARRATLPRRDGIDAVSWQDQGEERKGESLRKIAYDIYHL